MESIRAAGIGLAGLALFATAPTFAAAAATPANCSVPVDRLLRRFELELPGATRVTRSVDIPADSEILIEAFEADIDSRLEVRAAGAEAVIADNPVVRWPANRVVIPKGPARKADITVIGLERARGSVDLRMSRLDSGGDRRCVEFRHAMARGDAAFARGETIYRAEVDAAPGVSEHAYQTSVDEYARAVQALGAGGFDEAQARLVHAYALLYAVERYREAAEAMLVAIARFEALEHEYGVDQARFYWAWAIVNGAERLTDEQEAKRRFAIARTTFLDVSNKHLRRGERYQHAVALAGAAYVSSQMDRYLEGLSENRQVLRIFEELNEPERVARARNNIAWYESEFGHYQEALKIHHELLAEGDNIKDNDIYLGSFTNAAFLELKMGMYDEALRHYSDAYAISVRSQFRADQALTLHGLGITYHAIGNFGEALGYLERALELRTEQDIPEERGDTLRAIANVLGDTGRGREAVARREEALRIAQRPIERARITLELIDDRIEIGDLAIAKSLNVRLLAAGDMSDPMIRTGATLASARIALAEGDAASAARDARAAAESYRSHDLVSSEFAALLVQARAACAAGARDQALDIAYIALQRAEEVRTFSSNPTLRASLWRPLRPAFSFTIGLLARANSCGRPAAADPLGALAIAEASRGRALEDFRRRSSEDSTRSGKNERRRELFEQLADVRQQLEARSWKASGDDVRLGILRSEAARLRREIDLSGGVPASSRLRAEDLRPALRARIDAVPQETAVVEYWLGKDEAFAWLLTRGRLQIVDLGSAQHIDAAARRLHDAMRGWLKGSVEDRIESARELHALIIAPLPADLARARSVYFIPDGALHAVPFAALAHGAHDKPRFLVDSHDVAVAPAFLSTASGPGRRSVRKGSPTLVVVDPVYTRDDARFDRATASMPAPRPAPATAAVTLRGSGSWVRLPATSREAVTITNLLDRDSVRVLSGFAANRDALLESELAKYDILHFATHAVADTEAPQLSALVLSTVDAQGKPRVGEVFAGDLADQRLSASLVVFSGCETALGRAEAGEGLLSLRYAAHASGAQTVIASLWPVMDAAGASLMDDLYADVIGREASPVAAVSRAMRGARTRWKDPALWAAFDVSVAGF